MTNSEPVPAKSEEQTKGHEIGDRLAEVRQEINRVFDRFGRSSWPDLWHSLGVDKALQGIQTDVSTRVDIAETDKAFEISAELPGMDENDVEITVSNGNIVIKGEKRKKQETKEKDYHRIERSYGRIRRSLPMPQGVDEENISAKFKKGVLTIVLPKTKKARKEQRKIQINSE